MGEKGKRREYKRVPEMRVGDPGATPYNMTLAREQRVREVLISIEETKILGEKLKECYMAEGVNHFAKCEELAKAFRRRIAPEEPMKGPVELADVE